MAGSIPYFLQSGILGMPKKNVRRSPGTSPSLYSRIRLPIRFRLSSVAEAAWLGWLGFFRQILHPLSDDFLERRRFRFHIFHIREAGRASIVRNPFKHRRRVLYVARATDLFHLRASVKDNLHGVFRP